MTRMEFTGLRNGRPVRVVWQDGELSGDAQTVDWIKYYAVAMDAHIIGPIGGPYSGSSHLLNPYVAAELIRSVFPGKVRMVGDLPLRIAPPGAIQ